MVWTGLDVTTLEDDHGGGAMQGTADVGEIASEEGLGDTRWSGATQKTGAFCEAALEYDDAGWATQDVEPQGMLLA